MYQTPQYAIGEMTNPENEGLPVLKSLLLSRNWEYKTLTRREANETHVLTQNFRGILDGNC